MKFFWLLGLLMNLGFGASALADEPVGPAPQQASIQEPFVMHPTRLGPVFVHSELNMTFKSIEDGETQWEFRPNSAGWILFGPLIGVGLS